MMHIAWRLAASDLRREPGRTLAVAVLLFVAAWIPAIVDAPAVLGALVALSAAGAATVGSVVLAERREWLLDRNGAGPGVQVLSATFGLVVPAAVAFCAGVAMAAVVGAGPSLVESGIISFILPVTAAPLAGWAASRAQRNRSQGPATRTNRRRIILIVVLVVTGLLFLPLGIILAGAYVASGSWSQHRVRRIGGLVFSILATGAAVVLLGRSRSWFDLSFALLLLLPVLAVAVAIIAVDVHGLVVTRAGRLGPRLRLALTPLALRGRVLAPLLALITVVMAAAVTEAVVGASFGHRETTERNTVELVTVQSGNSPDQAIVRVPPVEADALRSLASRTLAATGATAVVIEQVGTGQPPDANLQQLANRAHALRGSEYVGPGGDRDRVPKLGENSVWIVPDVDWILGDVLDVGSGSQWIGIVDSDQLPLLGWQDAAKPLAAGKMVRFVEGGRGGYDLPASVVVGDHTVPRDGRVLDGLRGGAELPGALVSAKSASELYPLATTARVVVVPSPDATSPPSTRRLVELARQIRSRTEHLPIAEPTGLSSEKAKAFDVYARVTAATDPDDAVHAGSDPVRISTSGPLNDVPILAGSADQGRRAALALLGLPVLITLAVVFLALGATRRDDEILQTQGAPARLRSLIAAIQAGVVTISAAAVAVVLGIGIPAASFAVYNRGADLPDIPLVVPWTVWLMIVAVPICTPGIAALLPLLRRPAGTSSAGDSLDPAW